MNFAETALAFFSHSKYYIVFFLSIVEGPVVMLSSGFLYRLGQFELAPLYFALMAGDFAADLGWYAVGRFAARPLINRFGDFLGLTPEAITKIEKRFKTYQAWILFISKITMGFGFALATLMVAGMLRVEIKKYALLNLLGGFIWTALLLSAGFLFGDIYARIIGPARVVFAVMLLLGVIFGIRAINKYLRQKEI